MLLDGMCTCVHVCVYDVLQKVHVEVGAYLL